MDEQQPEAEPEAAGEADEQETEAEPEAASEADEQEPEAEPEAASAADEQVPEAGGAPLASVRVPASSANLGPGFDVLAVALDLPLVVRAVPHDGRRVVTRGLGADELPQDDSNLVWRSVQAFCDVYGADLPDVTLHCENDILLERGLGSSAAAAVAGLVLARILTDVAVSDQDLIDLAAQLEGHADNAAAAVLGGLVVAGPTGRARRFDPVRSLRPLVGIPPQRSSTSATRSLLPSDVTLETMVATTRRTALVLAGLAGMTAWDPTTMVDEVHEPARLATMPDSLELLAAARDAGYGACLSGAGPTVLIIADNDDAGVVERLRDATGEGWRIERLAWDRAGARSDQPVTSAR